ncbi:D-alanyl-D-alanine carboxypeptidase DacC [Sphaerisporangium krabiense]|uniref:D-alanyl-D-alanine carboxypeptidase/D-alanyl-D-alanine-endopeptidase (Penicillin-binding protein 4) n=1 Tax=Sphaerisporangium krabiense TaxID=763782 RepID=A0A7W9DQW3_9ACTN|nr:D-alanyl-D-alanine carboxypeptidase/D-alanyl-D-alanine-endopeptidase [Sphaerisporangium krabiense]MBB5627803.1 D-alanyl-D-alanine carboxypeptidase/D-alanyl-D-alanine-endopeptidase (penicillin-binding protein 4) [Sphaerisporangium krabiense]GII61962.1 D-alanyl-D-alanine carboxypeptidase DacC [Sphaerisporangium krabiense]
MRKRRPWITLSVAAALAATLTQATGGATATADDPAPGVTDLVQDLDRLLGDPRLVVAGSGLVVRSAATGEQLYAKDAGKVLAPASNTKLLTSAAAVDTLGLDYRFTTSVLSAGRRAGATLTGDLYLKGTGDPTMLASDYDALAAKVASAGVKLVTGRLVADDTWFDASRLGTDWAQDDEPYSYAAQISALTAAPDTDYDAGSLIVSVAPGGAQGSPAKVGTTPQTGHVTIENHATTGARTDVTVTREHGTNRIVVTGTVAGAYDEWIAVDDPTGYAASLFRTALTRHGVRVLGRTSRGAAPGTATSVAARTSMPLRELLVPFMKLSNNMHAEILTKAMGRKVSGAGSWSAGLAVTRAFAAANGIKALSLRDGSGLSRADGVTPGELTAYLIALRAKPWFPAWYDALPVAGVSDRLTGGTLRSRMAGTPAAGNVHAKTGSLTGVSGLSGYVTGVDGEPLVFSILTNNYLSGSLKDFEDAVAVRLARFSRTTPADTTGAHRSAKPAPDGDLECSWRKPVSC